MGWWVFLARLLARWLLFSSSFSWVLLLTQEYALVFRWYIRETHACCLVPFQLATCDTPGDLKSTTIPEGNLVYKMVIINSCKSRHKCSQYQYVVVPRLFHAMIFCDDKTHGNSVLHNTLYSGKAYATPVVRMICIHAGTTWCNQ